MEDRILAQAMFGESSLVLSSLMVEGRKEVRVTSLKLDVPGGNYTSFDTFKQGVACFLKFLRDVSIDRPGVVSVTVRLPGELYIMLGRHPDNSGERVVFLRVGKAGDTPFIYSSFEEAKDNFITLVEKKLRLVS